MRRLSGLLILSALAFPALADEPSTKPEPAPAQHGRVTWQQHFAAANVGHDGHLTLDEAKSGYVLIAKHFNEIDIDHKGYVTEGDIRVWRVMRKAAHQLTKPLEDKLRPRSAIQRALPESGKSSAARGQNMASLDENPGSRH